MALEGSPQYEDAVADWDLTQNDASVGWVVMDPWQQVDKVILLPGTTPEQQLEVLRHTAAHAAQYVVHRDSSNGIFTVTRRGQRSDYESFEMMRRPNIPDHVAAMDANELRVALKQLHIDVIDAVVWTESEALALALGDERLHGVELNYTLGSPRNYDQLRMVTFTVDEPAQFRAWHNINRPTIGGYEGLYIVPVYHPSMQGKSSRNLVNGATEALIGGEAIRSILPPIGSVDVDPAKSWFGDSWAHASHPFYLAGQDITVSLSSVKVLGRKGIQEVVNLLVELLGLENTYLAVSGGFRGPLEYPGNLVRHRGIYTSSHRGEVRGSEGVCVWSYQVLAEEGELDGAYIPPWFFGEGWLDAYGYEAASSK